MAIEWTRVVSSFCDAVGYDHDTQQLVIQFADNRVYEYGDTNWMESYDVYHAIVTAQSIGKAVHSMVISQGIPYKPR